MEGQFEAVLGNRPVGKVQLTRQGLYCRVVCRCILPQDGVYRLYALGDQGRENLGVVVPDGEGFLLDKKIPAKRLCGGNLQFILSSGVPSATGAFYPISPEEPFQYIDRLKTAFLESEQGKVGIRIREHPETT